MFAALPALEHLDPPVDRSTDHLDIVRQPNPIEASSRLCSTYLNRTHRSSAAAFSKFFILSPAWRLKQPMSPPMIQLPYHPPSR